MSDSSRMVKINEGEGEAELFVLLVIEGELIYPTKQPVKSLHLFFTKASSFEAASLSEM